MDQVPFINPPSFEILDFVRFLKVKQLKEERENQQDLEDARAG